MNLVVESCEIKFHAHAAFFFFLAGFIDIGRSGNMSMTVKYEPETNAHKCRFLHIVTRVFSGRDKEGLVSIVFLLVLQYTFNACLKRHSNMFSSPNFQKNVFFIPVNPSLPTALTGKLRPF